MVNETVTYDTLSQTILDSACAMQKVFEEYEKNKATKKEDEDGDLHIYPVVCM